MRRCAAKPKGGQAHAPRQRAAAGPLTPLRLRCDAVLVCADDVRAVFPVPSMRRWVEYYEEYCRAQRAAPAAGGGVGPEVA